PLRRDRTRDLRVTVTRQIDQHHLRMGLAGFPINADEVDGPRSSRSRAHVGKFLPEQGIDEARLADVRATEKPELWRTPFRKSRDISSGCDELGEDRLQTDSVPQSVPTRSPGEDIWCPLDRSRL